MLVRDKQTFLNCAGVCHQGLAKLHYHLNTNYYRLCREWQYKDIEPRIFAEELLDPIDDQLRDYKFHIMNDKLSHIDVISDRLTSQAEIALDANWNKLPFDYLKQAKQIPPRPDNLEDMIEAALKLARGLDYVRVDLYTMGNRIFAGELTLTPAGGTDRFNPPEWDEILGRLWVKS